MRKNEKRELISVLFKALGALHPDTQETMTINEWREVREEIKVWIGRLNNDINN